MKEVDDIQKIERRIGHRMGPIRTKTTILHSPDESFLTNYSRILRGEIDKDFLRARNLYVMTDDRPFHFDVNPAHPVIKRAMMRTLLIMALLIPFVLSFLARYRSGLRSPLPYVFVVALTGMGYLLIEVVLIQRYEIFLGSPVVTFSTILGTLLIFSGLGGLWSGRISQPGMYSALGAIPVLLMLHWWWIPSLFPIGASLPLSLKVAFSVVSLAPLAFFMGVPFPYVLRTSKMRYAVCGIRNGDVVCNKAATSALAVPLAINISVSYGLIAIFLAGIFVYMVVSILMVSIDKQKLQVLANAFAILFFALLLNLSLDVQQTGI